MKYTGRKRAVVILAIAVMLVGAIVIGGSYSDKVTASQLDFIHFESAKIAMA